MRVVGIDGGGSFTKAGLYNDRALVRELESTASNPILLGIDASIRVLIELIVDLLDKGGPMADVIACGVSGARRFHLREAIAHALSTEFGAERVIVTEDLRPVLMANAGQGQGVLAIAGTGSAVVAQDGPVHSRIVGGRGTLFGDDGSAYQLGVAGLRAAAEAADGMGPSTVLGETLPHAAGVPGLDELVLWAQDADKRQVARLSKAVTAAADEGDAVADACVRDQARRLARQVLAGADRLGLADDAPVFLNGGLVEHCERYREALSHALGETRLTAAPEVAPLLGHRAVIELAYRNELPPGAPISVVCRGEAADGSGGLPPTERRRADAPHIDALSPSELVDHMCRDAAAIAPAVMRQQARVAEAIAMAGDSLSSGGRLIYIGAGTSGRLGVLDASECPPTFGVLPETVIGLIAGGEAALRNSIEGAEDDRALGRNDIASIEPPVTQDDTVVGIAASGTTPYVHGGLEEAATRGASTVLVCCNPACRDGADCVIALDTGPEVLPGSTRLKAGTATKLVLNLISTGAMARAGYVYDGLMVGMKPVNAKLHERAARIVAALTGLDEAGAREALNKAGNDIRAAVVMTQLDVDATEATARLAAAGGRLGSVLP
ncbi:MAG: N-acetylmuramic acid 6-phosphate etherase [bacterium]|nr:N-acetylmuramic acid 6-phosphate etherase [bacterium]